MQTHSLNCITVPVVGSPSHLLVVDVYCNELMLVDQVLSDDEVSDYLW